MRGTRSPEVRLEYSAVRRAGGLSFAWKLLVATLILVVLFVGVPVQQAVAVSARAVLLLWGALFVAIADYGLLSARPTALRWSQVALAVGAYLALTIPVVVTDDPSKLLDALGPVVALSLVAQLGRPNVPQAVRDWALEMGLALCISLGIQSMWFLMTRIELLRFLLIALLPPVLFEASLLVVNRVQVLPPGLRQGAALAVAVLLPVGVFTSTQLEPTMPAPWVVFFDVVIALLVGFALAVSLMTRPLVDLALGSRRPSSGGAALGRAFAELTYGPMLIGLVMYLPLRIFFMQGIGS